MRRILDAALSVLSRRGILAAVVEDFGAEAVRGIHAAMGKRLGLRDVLEAHLTAIRQREGFYAALVVESPRLPEGVRCALVLIQSAIAFHFGPAAAADSAAGRIKKLPLSLLFNSWLGLVHHYLANQDLFAPGASVIEQRGSELIAFFWELVRKGDRREDLRILRHADGEER